MNELNILLVKYIEYTPIIAVSLLIVSYNIRVIQATTLHHEYSKRTRDMIYIFIYSGLTCLFLFSFLFFINEINPEGKPTKCIVISEQYRVQVNLMR
jgi:hypothetical protein